MNEKDMKIAKLERMLMSAKVLLKNAPVPCTNPIFAPIEKLIRQIEELGL